MSGHNRYSTIRHRKGAQDARRSRIFSKLSSEIIVAAREGGVDPALNPRLRTALQNARAQNMPKDNIERALRRASGVGGAALRPVTFEGYGPYGVAIFVDALTDNNNRTVSHVRALFSRHGGTLGVGGCLQFIFVQRGIFSLSLPAEDAEDLLLELIEEGIEEYTLEADELTLSTPREQFAAIRAVVEARGITVRSAGLRRVPVVQRPVSSAEWPRVGHLVDALLNGEDVQQVVHNAVVA